MTTLYTIGFAGWGAEAFFTALQEAGIRRMLDIRLNNVSQLAGFAKRDDLRYFLRELCDADYAHIPDLAPSKELLKGYRDGSIDWPGYVAIYAGLLQERRALDQVRLAELPGACLLCSEHVPDQCHRRLVAEALAERWPALQVVHLV